MTDESPSADWYKNFFDGAALELWRRAITPEATEAEIEFLLESLEVAEGASLIDVPCGNGRLSLPLAQAGYAITGVDLSAAFIKEAKAAAVAAGVSVDYIEGDVLQFAPGKKFAGAYCMGNSFGYFDRAGTAKFFRNVADSLESGGKFVIDSAMAAECFLVNGGEREWVQVGDMLMLIENKYDCRLSCVETEYTFIRGGKEEKRVSMHWIYTAGEIAHMLAAADFTVTEMYGSSDFEEFALGSERLLLVAERN